MTGQDLYEAHRATATDLGIDLPDWEALDPLSRADWEGLSVEQADRDALSLAEGEGLPPAVEVDR